MVESENESASDLAIIRRRPAMFIGSTGLFGFIHYLVSPFSLLLSHGANRITATVADPIEVAADAVLPLTTTPGRGNLFEDYLNPSHGLDGAVLNALSRELVVLVRTPTQSEELVYRQGTIVSRDQRPEANANPGTTLRFSPDPTIFSVTGLPAAMFTSYFRRMSYLHRGVRFSLTVGGEAHEFFAENGVRDLFASIAAPYHLMHEPMHLVATEDGLGLEVVLAYQSWTDHHLWCFINNGRAVEGGTHEQGLLQALRSLPKKLGLPAGFRNGVVAVASMDYPGAMWKGCIKAKVGNPELRSLVSRLVVREAVKWVQGRPALAADLQHLQTFLIPEIWATRGEKNETSA